ncbi:MAG: DUF922 domain-containing protein [Bdellovibrionales bacterium]|nr:DUF922 domain-containing protein [Bdellovibrionales bacterium]
MSSLFSRAIFFFSIVLACGGCSVVAEEFSFADPLASARSAPHIEVTYYDLTGLTISAIRRSLRQESLRIARAERSEVAKTSWQFSWKWPRQGDRPLFEKAVVSVRFSVLFPRWIPPTPEAERVAGASWRAFAEALAAHEQEHIEITERVVADLQRELRGIALKNREQGVAPEKQMIQVALKRLREAQQEFDRVTPFGLGTSGKLYLQDGEGTDSSSES